jgi:hypothetical protein
MLLRRFLAFRIPELICAIIAIVCVFVDAGMAVRFLRLQMADGDGKNFVPGDSTLFYRTQVVLFVVAVITFVRALKRSRHRRSGLIR